MRFAQQNPFMGAPMGPQQQSIMGPTAGRNPPLRPMMGAPRQAQPNPLRDQIARAMMPAPQQAPIQQQPQQATIPRTPARQFSY